MNFPTFFYRVAKGVDVQGDLVLDALCDVLIHIFLMILVIFFHELKLIICWKTFVDLWESCMAG